MKKGFSKVLPESPACPMEHDMDTMSWWGHACSWAAGASIVPSLLFGLSPGAPLAPRLGGVLYEGRGPYEEKRTPSDTHIGFSCSDKLPQVPVK